VTTSLSAVIGTGITKHYPAANRRLQDHIAASAWWSAGLAASNVSCQRDACCFGTT
jgi:hypothetical protein